MAILFTLALIPLTILLVLFLRICVMLSGAARKQLPRRVRGSPAYILVVLGSGGHTAEMLMLLRDLDSASYTFRRYVVSTGDSFSATKAAEFEEHLARTAADTGKLLGSFDIRFVPRARLVHQSLLTTPLTATSCLLGCIQVLRDVPPSLGRKASDRSPYPDLIITNGPATATVMLIASFILRMLLPVGSLHQMRCVYVESWARVKNLSLSGTILRTVGICDRLLVQWPSLAAKGAEYRGQLVA